MKTYGVLIPIAGHAYIEVEADDVEEAEEKAFMEIKQEHIEDWDLLRAFNRGNVCYCPSPWEVEVGEIE